MSLVYPQNLHVSASPGVFRRFLSITLNIKPQGSILEQEEQIAAAVAEVGRLATELSMKGFDTNGQPIISDNVKHTSRGEEKKLSKHRGEK